MIVILILVVIAGGFARYAGQAGLNRILWGFLGLLGYFAGAFLAGIVLGLLDQNYLEDGPKLYAYAFGGSAVGVGGMYLLLWNIAKNKKTKVADSGVLDDDL